MQREWRLKVHYELIYGRGQLTNDPYVDRQRAVGIILLVIRHLEVLRVNSAKKWKYNCHVCRWVSVTRTKAGEDAHGQILVLQILVLAMLFFAHSLGTLTIYH